MIDHDKATDEEIAEHNRQEIIRATGLDPKRERGAAVKVIATGYKAVGGLGMAAWWLFDKACKPLAKIKRWFD